MTVSSAPPKPTKWLLLAVGWTFMALGVLGLFLPVLQGVLFLLIGLIILSSEYVWAHQLLGRLKERFPHLSQGGHGIATKATAWFHRLRPAPRAPASCESIRSEGYDKTGTAG